MYIYIFTKVSVYLYIIEGIGIFFLCVWMIIFKITTSIDTSNLSSLWDLGESSDQFAGVFALGGIQSFMISVEHFNLWRKEWWFIHQCCIKTDAFWLIVSSLIHFFAKLWCVSFLSDIGAHVWDPKNAQNEISGAILFNHIDGQIYMCKGHNLDQGQFDVCFGSCLYVFVTLNFMLFLFLKCYLMGVVFGQMQKLVAAWLCGCLYIKIHNNVTSFFTCIYFFTYQYICLSLLFPKWSIKKYAVSITCLLLQLHDGLEALAWVAGGVWPIHWHIRLPPYLRENKTNLHSHRYVSFRLCVYVIVRPLSNFFTEIVSVLLV